MSYILDALNKSEEEKKQHKTPGLNTIHIRADRQRSRNSKWLWPAFGLVLVLINLGFVLWFTADKGNTVSNQNITNPHQVRPSPAATTNPKPQQYRPAKLIQNANKGSSNQTAQNRRSTLKTVDVPRQTKAALPEPTQDRLSPEIQINDIWFSSHIYAEDRSLRMVVINGKRFREGDPIARNLELQAITQEGVIVKQGNQLIPISVLSNWAED